MASSNDRNPCVRPAGSVADLPHPRIHDHSEITRCDVIGDVHGCYDELEMLLRRLGHADLLDPNVAPAAPGELPAVIFVGDVVDRGDRILDSVRLVNRLCRRGRALTVVGNHDDRFLRWLCGKSVKLQHGLQETVAEFETLSSRERDALRDELIDFYAGLPWAIRIDGGRAMVAHAAWHAELAEERSTDRIRAYTLYGPVTGNKTPEGFPERVDWAPGYRGPEVVIFGHQVYDEPYRHEYAIGIDTGCVFGGALTALRYPEIDFVSIPSLRERYPRRGRKSEET